MLLEEMHPKLIPSVQSSINCD